MEYNSIDADLIWEAYTDKHGNYRGGKDPNKKPEEGGAKDSALNPDKRSSRKSNDPNERARAREYATRGQGAEGERQKKRMEAEDETKTKNEGAFGGPGGNFDKEGWGEETSDDPDDPAFGKASNPYEVESVLGDAIEQHEAERGMPYQLFDDDDWDQVYELAWEESVHPNKSEILVKLIADKKQDDIRED